MRLFFPAIFHFVDSVIFPIYKIWKVKKRKTTPFIGYEFGNSKIKNGSLYYDFILLEICEHSPGIETNRFHLHKNTVKHSSNIRSEIYFFLCLHAFRSNIHQEITSNF